MKQLFSDIILVLSLVILFFIGAFLYSIYTHVSTISGFLSEYTIELTQ